MRVGGTVVGQTVLWTSTAEPSSERLGRPRLGVGRRRTPLGVGRSQTPALPARSPVASPDGVGRGEESA